MRKEADGDKDYSGDDDQARVICETFNKHIGPIDISARSFGSTSGWQPGAAQFSGRL